MTVPTVRAVEELAEEQLRAVGYEGGSLTHRTVSEIAARLGFEEENFKWTDTECLEHYVDWNAPACEGIDLDGITCETLLGKPADGTPLCTAGCAIDSSPCSPISLFEGPTKGGAVALSPDESLAVVANRVDGTVLLTDGSRQVWQRVGATWRVISTDVTDVSYPLV